MDGLCTPGAPGAQPWNKQIIWAPAVQRWVSIANVSSFNSTISDYVFICSSIPSSVHQMCTYIIIFMHSVYVCTCRHAKCYKTSHIFTRARDGHTCISIQWSTSFSHKKPPYFECHLGKSQFHLLSQPAVFFKLPDIEFKGANSSEKGKHVTSLNHLVMGLIDRQNLSYRGRNSDVFGRMVGCINGIWQWFT